MKRPEKPIQRNGKLSVFGSTSRSKQMRGSPIFAREVIRLPPISRSREFFSYFHMADMAEDMAEVMSEGNSDV
jgi:hypothetical protein